jgi:hypothetical protein
MRWALGGLGALLCVAGAVVFALANRSPVGWTAYTGSYAPLGPAMPGRYSDAYQSELTLTFSDGWSVLWTGDHLLGALLVVLGLLVLAAVGGWALGRRSGRRSSDAAAG